MNLIDMFHKEAEDAKKRLVPYVIPIGTMEYHAQHASYGCDTMVITGMLDRLGKEKEIIVAPPIWYGVASYAVSGPEKNTIQIRSSIYEQYVHDLLKSLLYGGWRNIYMVYHHQSEKGNLMPMTLACMKAAKDVTMEYMEEKVGLGWWGGDGMKDFYAIRDTAENPLKAIKTIPLMNTEVQLQCGGFDHAGKFETSLLWALYPKNVDYERTAWNEEWFAQPAKEASLELGERMVKFTLAYLKETIV